MEHVEEAMTTEYLSTILKATVDLVKITAGSNPGDNYMCVMYSIEVVLSSGESRFLVLKTYPNHTARQQMLEMTNVFLKEFAVYDVWFPTFDKLQAELGRPGEFPLSVPIFLDGAAVDNLLFSKAAVDPNAPPKQAIQKPNILQNFLLMEDARKKGFRMANRIKGLDAEHSKLLLRELGKFHALGWVYKTKNGISSLVQKFPYLEESMFKPEMVESFQPVFDAMVAASTKMLEESLGLDSPVYKNYTALMAQNTTKYLQYYMNENGIDMDQIERLIRVKTQFPDGFNKEPWLLPCHGDCWVNNFLFRYKTDDTKGNLDPTPVPVEILMLDFQWFREACPTTDLAYFLFTSTTDATRKVHMDEFLQVYHDSFLQVCKSLHTAPLPGFSIESLKLRFRQANFFGLMISLPLLFAVLKNPDTAEDLDNQEMGAVCDVCAKGFGIKDENALLRERLTEVVVGIYNNGIL